MIKGLLGIFFLHLGIALPLAAQILYTGRALNFDTKKPLDSVIVEWDSQFTTSNVAGFFQLTAHPSAKIKVSRREFISDSLSLPSSNRFDFYLKRIETPYQTELKKSFYKYLSDGIKYPAEARRIRAQGIVLVYFEVNNDSEVTKIEVLNETRKDFKDQFIKLIPKAPRVWYSIKKHDKFILPVSFAMQGGSKVDPVAIPTNTGAIVLSEISVAAYFSVYD